VVATRQIGDVLLTTPMVRAARALWPQARIEVLGFQGTLGMLECNPDIDGLVPLPPKLGFRGGLQAVRSLWRRYDLALITDVGDRAHLLGWVAARSRSGVLPPSSSSNWWKRLLLSHCVVSAGDRGEVHVVREKNALLAPWAGGEVDGPLRVVPPSPAPLPPGLDAAVRRGAVVVHAPSMWSYKQWPLPHYGEVVRALLADGHQVVLTGTRGERDQECIAPLRSLGQAPTLIDASGQLNFRQTVALLRRAGLYIGPDTSISHLAAAVGLPVLAVFGPTNPMRWAPWPGAGGQAVHYVRVRPDQQVGNVTLLQSGLPCVPCGRAGCDDHRHSRSDCLTAISPERLLEHARRLIGPEAAAGAAVSDVLGRGG
jgi:heptosyltransferase III